MKKINNRGELTTQQLITIIILIISFAVLMIFIFRLNLRGEATNKEICHNSVLLKEKTRGSLDCRISYICISGGGKCEDFNSNQEIVKINMNPKLKEGENKKQNIKNQIMKIIADEMADCWWMFGEGQVDYVGLGLKSASIGDVNCAICSRVKFNEEVSKLGNIDANFFTEFLKSNEKNKGTSYLYYLYKINDADKLKVEGINLASDYSVLTGFAKEGLGSKFFFAPWNFVKSFFVENQGAKVEYGAFPTIIKEQNKVSEIKCDKFLTKA